MRRVACCARQTSSSRLTSSAFEAFGYNIANTALVEVLYRQAAATLPLLQPSNVDRIALVPDCARLSSKQGWEISARLLVGADGRNSVCRDAAHIPAAMQHDGQAAIATSFTPCSTPIAVFRSSCTARAAR